MTVVLPFWGFAGMRGALWSSGKEGVSRRGDTIMAFGSEDSLDKMVHSAQERRDNDRGYYGT